MILQHDRNREAVRDLLVHLDDTIVVGHRLLRRRYHHRVGAEVLRHARQVGCGACAAVAAPDDDRQPPVDDRHRLFDERVPLVIAQAVRLTEHAEDRDAVHAEPDHEFEQPPPRLRIEALVVPEWRGQDGNDALEHDLFRHERQLTR